MPLDGWSYDRGPAAGGRRHRARTAVITLAERAARGDLARCGSPERVTEFTARCLIHHVPALLGRHSSPVLAVATALAALERTTRPLLLRELTGLDDAAVAGAVTVLEQTGLLRPGPPWQLCHPPVREALLAHSGTAAAAEPRSRAVRTLADLDGAAAEAADLLLVTEPEGDVRRTGMLCTAAQQALDRGVPGAAAAYLRRVPGAARSWGPRPRPVRSARGCRVRRRRATARPWCARGVGGRPATSGRAPSATPGAGRSSDARNPGASRGRWALAAHSAAVAATASSRGQRAGCSAAASSWQNRCA
ncbi:hypothetical protein [Streptomyces sp. PR69]|uniref:hypothetical protein n=1 Tax=Streptomyces sp. PR69 TaxID=2984950 RepID=UPI00226402CD|nr:hypothetical protein [Streptomyces sp. PR69]